MRDRKAEIFVQVETDDSWPVDPGAAVRGQHLKLRGAGGDDEVGVAAFVDGPADVPRGLLARPASELLGVLADHNVHQGDCTRPWSGRKWQWQSG